ncbi:MAG: hypothetical protein WD737_00395 [Gemmatimonadota bacterium]
MFVQRPLECPACGHERPRRPSRNRLRNVSRSEGEEYWVCGLCRYEWAVSVDRAASPQIRFS